MSKVKDLFYVSFPGCDQLSELLVLIRRGLGNIDSSPIVSSLFTLLTVNRKLREYIEDLFSHISSDWLEVEYHQVPVVDVSKALNELSNNVIYIDGRRRRNVKLEDTMKLHEEIGCHDRQKLLFIYQFQLAASVLLVRTA